jgi:hypothetical protein
MVAAPSFHSGTSGPVAHPHRLYLCTADTLAANL